MWKALLFYRNLDNIIIITTRIRVELPGFRRCLTGFMVLDSPLLLLRLTLTLVLRLNDPFPGPNFWMFWLSTRTSLTVRASCPEALLWFGATFGDVGELFSPWEGRFLTFFFRSFNSWCSFNGTIDQSVQHKHKCHVSMEMKTCKRYKRFYSLTKASTKILNLRGLRWSFEALQLYFSSRDHL